MNMSEQRGTNLDSELREVLGEFYQPILNARRNQQRNRLQARLPLALDF